MAGNYKHGHAPEDKSRRASLYTVWMNMRDRCNRPSAKTYDRYGGRGIRVCPAWDDYQSFYDWAHASGYQEGLTIERVNNDGDYSPENCRWATRADQARNRRTTRLFTVDGETKCMKDWAADPKCQVTYLTLYMRVVRLGWDFERALATPSQRVERERG